MDLIIALLVLIVVAGWIAAFGFARLNAAGTTIVQVTHSDENARYGHRTIHLKDGWME